jgi:hypothetical protein
MAIKWREWRLAVAAFLLLGMFALKGVLIEPPSPPVRPAPSEFDTQRALVRLERILGDQRPHPVDSEANDAVRARLMAEISALGLEPEVREAMDCSGFPKSRTVSCSRVRNVIAVIPGGPLRDALLINSHYDSTPTGPGAADDGIGVATMLEVAHHLRGERLARPVILLFNEGEEYGLNGAAVFAESDPLARTVGRLINIEARGVSGPAFMFETSEPNGLPLSDYAASTKRPFANSMSADFAKLIPNSTDVVKFKSKGWETLSYAIIGNETRYHSPGDDLAHLDRASVAHMGSEVLSAARRLGAPTVPVQQAPTAYTDIGGLFLINVPLLLGKLLLAGLLAASLLLVVRHKAWRSMAGLAIAVIGGVAAAAIVSVLAGLLRAGDYWRAYPFVTTLAVAATILAVEAWLIARAADRNDRPRMRVAAWTLILIAGAAATFMLPGAVIFFLIAPALALGGILIARRSEPLGAGLVWAGALLQLVMFAELTAQIELTLIDGPAAAVAPLVAMAALPVLAELGRGASRWTLAVLALAAAVLWAGAMLLPRSAAKRPAAFTVDHVQDGRTGKAVWAIASKQAPLPAAYDRVGPWRAGPLPYNKRERWQAPAPQIDGPSGAVTVLADRADGTGRQLRLRLDRGGADALLLRFDEDTPILTMGLPGRPRKIDEQAEKGPTFIRCTGRSCDGLVVDVAITSPKPAVAMLIAQRFTPPAEAAPLLALRPRDAHAQYSPDSQLRISAVKL